jgi:TonB family protein
LRKLLLVAGIVALTASVIVGLMAVPRLRAQDGPFSPGTNGVGWPSCLHCPDPKYSKEALKAKYHGSVMLQAIILPDGTATDIQVVVGGPHGLGVDEKDVEAVKKWRFKPAFGPMGTPVATIVPIEVTFHLPN